MGGAAPEPDLRSAALKKSENCHPEDFQNAGVIFGAGMTLFGGSGSVATREAERVWKGYAVGDYGKKLDGAGL